MASTVIQPIAAGIADVADGMTGLSTATKGFTWAPKSGDVDAPPAAVVYTPAIERTDVGPDIPEDHIGFNDWTLDFPVHWYFDAGDLSFAQTQIAEVLEAFIKAIDASMDPTKPLNGLCDDIKVTRVEEPNEAAAKNNRTLWEVRTRVRVVTFVAV